MPRLTDTSSIEEAPVYVPYTRALALLKARLDATPAEVAL
jgi:hypothetical protein